MTFVKERLKVNPAPIDTTFRSQDIAQTHGIFAPNCSEFVVQFAAGRAAHAANFAPIDPARNADRTAEWPGFAPYVKAINELKRARPVVVLAHTYRPPEIVHCVADGVGVIATTSSGSENDSAGGAPGRRILDSPGSGPRE